MGGQESLLMYVHFLILLIISWLLLCCIGVIAETNTLNKSDTLNSTGVLVSNNSIFTLGFFKSSYTNNTYLSIWYSKSQYLSSGPLGRLWIANRATPIASNDSATLITDSTGTLVTNRTLGDPIPLCRAETTTTSSYRNTIAVLQDDGNLVLREVNSNGSVGRTLWQSFDCPTYTLLPGMKLGVNRRTGRTWTLTSWLAEDDPSPGPFTLEWDPNERQLVIRRRGVDFWTSGVLKNDSFERMWSTNPTFLQSYHLMSTNTSDEGFFSYSQQKNVPLTDDGYTGGLWRMGPMGDLYYFENLAVPLDVTCYGYNEDDG